MTGVSIEAFGAACPPGHLPFIVTLRSLDDFQAGDVVLGHRADNGLRGARRVRAGVIVGRYITKDAS